MFCVLLPSSVHWRERRLFFLLELALPYLPGLEFGTQEHEPTMRSSNATSSRRSAHGREGWVAERVVLNANSCSESSKTDTTQERGGTPNFPQSPLSPLSITKVDCLSLTTWL